MTTTSYSREFLLSEMSDISKEANGFRMRLNWDAMTTEKLQEYFDWFVAQIEQNAHARVQAEWEAHIASLMADNGIDRATALRWDITAMDADMYDIGFYCFLWGIDYKNEATIKEIIGA